MQKRIPASSIVEITVAAVILVLVFSLALAICARLAQHGPSQRQQRGQQLVQELAATTLRSRAWHDQTTVVGSFTLERVVAPYQRGQPSLLHLQVRALDQEQKVLAQYQQVIYVPVDHAP